MCVWGGQEDVGGGAALQPEAGVYADSAITLPGLLQLHTRTGRQWGAQSTQQAAGAAVKGRNLGTDVVALASLQNRRAQEGDTLCPLYSLSSCHPPDQTRLA